MWLAVAIQLGPYGVNPSSAFGSTVGFAVVMTALAMVLGLFRIDERASLALVLSRTMMVLAIGFPVVYLLFTFVPDTRTARDVLGYAGLYTLSGVILMRAAVSAVLGVGIGARRVLIIGTGEEALAVEDVLGQMGPRKSVVVGFYPTGTDEPPLIDRPGKAHVIPRSLQLPAIVEQFNVGEVVVAVREQRGGVLPLRDLLDCRISGVPVYDLSAFYERVRGEVPIESLKASWLIYGDGFAQDPMRSFIKRSFDIFASLFLIVLNLPLMCLAAIAIFIESGGPLLFTQERVGRGGRNFKCIKFRSMYVDAEKDGVARWATANDSRVTRVGRVLRKMRIDELPQLFNVLSGEMSLVGPRPERPVFVAQLKEQIRFYDVRHSIKPGITGWAQVRYSYGSSIEDAQRKLQYDLYYVKNHSLALDVLVLVETIRVVLFSEGAQ
jgi:sugar transferase (PEP-CTERM system associated)